MVAELERGAVLAPRFAAEPQHPPFGALRPGLSSTARPTCTDLTCVYRKSDPDVLALQSTEDRVRYDASDALNGA